MVTIPYITKDILMGIMLGDGDGDGDGDGHIVTRSYTANSRLVYAQTAVAHKKYFNYVYSFF